MKVHVFFEPRPDSARASLQTFTSIHQYLEEAYSKWHSTPIQRLLMDGDSIAIVSYIDHFEAIEDAEHAAYEALSMVKTSTKRSDTVIIYCTSVCPVKPGFLYSAFTQLNYQNFVLEL